MKICIPSITLSRPTLNMLQMPLSYLCVKEWLGKNKNKNLLEDMYVEKHIIIDDLPFAKVLRE